MSIPVRIQDPHGHRANVDRQGNLRVSDGAFDLTKFVELAETGTAYNFYTPVVGHQFVVTGILCFADKDVNDASDTVIEIYEATSPSSTTVARCILQFGMGQLTVLPWPSVKLLVSEGVYINAKTGDDDIHLNIIGHFIKTIEPDLKAAPGVA